jgi:hypothetical protein
MCHPQLSLSTNAAHRANRNYSKTLLNKRTPLPYKRSLPNLELTLKQAVESGSIFKKSIKGLKRKRCCSENAYEKSRHSEVSQRTESDQSVQNAVTQDVANANMIEEDAEGEIDAEVGLPSL